MNLYTDLKAWANNFGLVGERKALALVCLGFYSFFFGLLGFLLLDQMPALAPAMLGLAGCYIVGFFALAADWFWARWFATGLGYWGLSTIFFVFIKTRDLQTPFVVFAVMHLVLWGVLLGDKMAAAYDNREEWRKRFQLDEQGVQRVRNTVTRVSTSLPMLILWALAPKEGEESLMALSAMLLAAGGLAGLLRGRTWGLLSLGASGALALAAAPLVRVDMAAVSGANLGSIALVTGLASAFPLFAICAGLLLMSSALPFVHPALSYLRSSRRQN